MPIHSLTPTAWIMRFSGADDSADWVELGEQQPEPFNGAVPFPLYSRAAFDAAVADERERLAATYEARADKRDIDDQFAKMLYALAMELRAERVAGISCAA
jgi:hypothetical protein